MAVLLPFLAKPFNVDDPLFVWAAQQIQKHPGNPYGFDVNWYGYSQPMWAATQNPPLMSYYLAGAAGLFGWSELGLHFACLLPAVSVVLGTHRLAGHLCRWPMFAALTVLFAPGFLVSSTTVMCDVLMLAFWTWAAVFWIEGIRQDDFRKLAAAGGLMALAVFAKYNGICLVPLLAAYGWLEKRRVGWWALFLLIPLLALGGGELLTYHLYGHPHFLSSHQYAQEHQAFQGFTKLFKVLNALTFIGGCFAAVLLCAPLLWRKTALALLVVGAGLCTALALAGGMMGIYPWLTGTGRCVAAGQIVLWTAGGLGVLALAVADVWKKRDAASGLLLLWVAGVFLFAATVYWMVNARVILPMAPVVGILIARRLETVRAILPDGIRFSIVACAALSLLAAQADFQQAATARKSAELACAKYAGQPGRVWFEGHWGFQYYMQAFGAWPLDSERRTLQSGDILVVPIMGSNTFRPEEQAAVQLDSFTVPSLPWVATMSPTAGAGFYSQLFGPLPFAVGRVAPENMVSFLLKNPAGKSP